MLLGENYGTVSDIEVFWVLLTFFSLCFSVYNTVEAVRDYRYLKSLHLSPNGEMDQAIGTIVAESARTGILMIFLSIGLIAMILPEAPDDIDIPDKQLIAGVLIRWGLIASALLIAVQTLNNSRIRRRGQLRARTKAKIEQELKQNSG